MSVASVGFSVPQAPMPAVDFTRGAQNKPEHNAANAASARPQVIESAALDLQKIGSAFNKKLRFEMDHQSKQVIVKVIDKETDKVIRELPPEELQRLHRNLKEAIGLLFDEMA